MPQPQIDRDNYTYGDYLTWPEEERWEIIDGTPYMMTAPSRIHQEISGELFVQFHSYLKDISCKVYAAPFSVRLPKGNERNDTEIDTVVEPDLALVCDLSKLDDQGCKGAPDLIIEIMSPGSVKNDMLKKFNRYEKAGVKEYWIIEPNGKVVTVFTLGENGRYGRQEVYSEEDEVQVKVCRDLKINLKPVFAY
ncbi:MAG TPA: Uma2 family endonuclease [Bacillota bacterium]|nr:Uma2 family endonuclease [Bacillota bacterium]